MTSPYHFFGIEQIREKQLQHAELQRALDRASLALAASCACESLNSYQPSLDPGPSALASYRYKQLVRS